MIWFIVGLAIAIVIIIRICCDDLNDLGYKIGFSALAFLSSMSIAFLVFLGASAIISNSAEIKYDIESDTKIIALKDNQNISGNFYIMGGYVGEDLYYYYATETEFGYKTEKVKAEILMDNGMNWQKVVMK